jgi:hypothetical protein
VEIIEDSEQYIDDEYYAHIKEQNKMSLKLILRNNPELMGINNKEIDDERN